MHNHTPCDTAADSGIGQIELIIKHLINKTEIKSRDRGDGVLNARQMHGFDEVADRKWAFPKL